MVSKVAGPPANEITTMQNQNFDDGKTIDNRTNIASHLEEQHLSKCMMLFHQLLIYYLTAKLLNTFS